jgi:hypothetical protein
MKYEDTKTAKAEAPKPAEKTVVVYLLEKMEDGTLRIGNSHECPVEEAELMIKQQMAKHLAYPIGVLPDEWN